MLGGRLFVPLRSADYRRLWAGQFVSVVGDKIDQIALGILVYQKTGSELQMGIMLAISMLPAALFGMLAGAFVDRWDRRGTMVVADVLRAACVFAVPFVAEWSLPAVYALAFAAGTIALFFEPAKLSLVPELVGHDDLMAANSLDNATSSVAELAGLLFGGALVAVLGYRAAFLLDGATFLISALLILSISHRSARPAGEKRISLGPVLGETVEGLRYVWGHPVLRDLLGVYSFAIMGVAASTTFIYALALDRFAAGAVGLATLDGAITVGLLAGSVIVGQADPSGPARKLLMGLLVFGVLVSFASVTPTIAATAAVLFCAGVANMFFYVPMATILQQDAEPSMRGRVFAAKQSLSRVLSVVGFIGAGALAEGIGLTPSILIAGMIVIAMSLYGWTRPQLRLA